MFRFLKGGAGGAVCAKCGGKLQRGEIFLVDGKQICAACYRQRKPGRFCAACGRQDTMYLWDGKQYCNSCYTIRIQREQCRLCKNRLLPREQSNTWTVEGVEYRFCDSCMRQVRERRPVTLMQLLVLQPERRRPADGKAEGRPMAEEEKRAVEVEGSRIRLWSTRMNLWLNRSQGRPEVWNLPLELTAREPVITLEDDGIVRRRYTLGVLPGEDLTGWRLQCRLTAVRQEVTGAPVILLEGLAEEPKERGKRSIPYRFEAYVPETAQQAETTRAAMEDAPPEGRGLRRKDDETPENTRLVGICPGCHGSITFQWQDFGMVDAVPVYSTDGLEVLALPAEIAAAAPEDWSAERAGHTFTLRSRFACPGCGRAYLPWQSAPGEAFRPGYRHLGHRVIRW